MSRPAQHRSREPPDDGPTTPRPKATLFCQQCGHENPVDGDWVEGERAGRRHVNCPNCSNRLTSRAGPDGRLPRPSQSGGVAVGFGQFVDIWAEAQSLWRTSVRTWVDCLPSGRADY